MGNTKLIPFYFIWISLVVTYADVEIELRVLQYDNPLGTSYMGKNYTDDRKCCDAGGSRCNGGNDTCDVYFYFCIGRLHFSNTAPACVGASLDMSQSVSMDVYKLTNTEMKGLTRYSKLQTWDISNATNFTRIIANIFDIDEIHKPGDTGDPSITPDMIDTFSTPLNFTPARDYWSAPQQVVKLRNHVSLAVGIRAWCATGWFGATCDRKCSTDIYHTCTSSGLLQPKLECTNTDELVLRLENSLPYLSDPRLLQSRLLDFVVESVCPSTTHNVSLTVDRITEYNITHIDVLSHGSCDGIPVSRLKFQQAIYVLNLLKSLRLKSPEAIFGNKVIQPKFQKIIQTKNDKLIKVFVMARIVKYENTGAHGCAQGNKGAYCNPIFTIMFNRPTIAKETILATNNLTDCNGILVDLSSTGNVNYTAKDATFLATLKNFTTITIVVQEFTADSNSRIRLATFVRLNKTVVGRNFHEAYPHRYDLHSNDVLMSVEVMAWCANCHYGDKCQYTNITCDTRVTVIYPDCSSNSDCKNNGVCFNETCLCTDSWTGATCNIDINECLLGMCQHVDTCTNTPGGYACSCSKGFTGKNCDQDVDECSLQRQCHGGSVCLNTYGSFVCTCKNGTLGDNCGGEDYCASYPCLNNANCTNDFENDNFTCACANGWRGRHCEQNVDECSESKSVLCQNGGTCIDTQGSFVCSCPSGITGHLCGSDMDECGQGLCLHNSTCFNTFGGFSCECSYGWHGNTCNVDNNECADNPCQHSSKCTNIDGGYTCTCDVGWQGQNCTDDRDECALFSNPCHHEGNCTNNPGSFACSCPPEWQGEHCTADVDECVTSYACHLNGNCTNTVGGHSCRCFTGWTGSDCATDINECQASPCDNGATCVNNNGGYTCSCPPSWTGVNCDADINECLLFPCKNGGTCLNLNGGYSCTCLKSWKGDNCIIDVDECSITTASNCNNGGMCKNIPGSYTCDCGPHWTGNICDTDVNECLTNNPCQNNGTCVNSDGGYTCKCPPSWAGLNCTDDVDECKLTSICLHGVCHNTIGSYNCSCVNGYYGMNCTIDRNECEHNPCQNSGTCVNTDGGYHCHCTKAWTGRNCSSDVNECNTFNPCSHGGTCINSDGSYACTCTAGWTGVTCTVDVDECDNVPCKNQGRCFNTAGSFSCQCLNGWEGSTCTINSDACSNIDCNNRGQCQDLVNGYKCICNSGYSGNDCQTNINDCAINACNNGAKCKDQIGYYDCICRPGWKGDMCDIDVDECKTRPCSVVQGCTNTPGSYTCIQGQFSSHTAVNTTTIETTSPSTTEPKVVDVFSLQFVGAVTGVQRPKISRGIHDILQLLTCHDSNTISVSLVHNSVTDPTIVEFHARCDGKHMTNEEINSAIRTLSTEKLASYFPVQLSNTQSQPLEQSWLSKNTPLVAGGGGAVVLIVVVLVVVFIVRKKRSNPYEHQPEIAMPEVIQDMDGSETITIRNPVYDSLYKPQSDI